MLDQKIQNICDYKLKVDGEKKKWDEFTHGFIHPVRNRAKQFKLFVTKSEVPGKKKNGDEFYPRFLLCRILSIGIKCIKHPELIIFT